MNALKAPPKWGVNIWDVFILWSLLREIKATSMKQRVFPLKTIYWHAKKNKKQIHLFPENDCCCSPLSPTALSPHSTSSIKTKIPALSVLMVLGHWQTPEWLHHNWYLFFFFCSMLRWRIFKKKCFIITEINLENRISSRATGQTFIIPSSADTKQYFLS